MALPNKNIYSIGYKIKAFREANNLTQEQLADLMNCNFKTVGNLENNRTMPDLRQVINLCDILKVSMDELFADVLNKTECLIEPSENEEGYPKLVKRKASSLSANQLQKKETLSLKIKNLNEKELDIVDKLIDALLNNR